MTNNKAMTDQQKWIPRNYQIDLERNCIGNAENLANMNKVLCFVVGFAKGLRDKKWGDHAWCVAPDGSIIDPYFQDIFPDIWDKVEYREDALAFEGQFEVETRISCWDNNLIQFPRLIAAMEAIDSFTHNALCDLATKMCLSRDEVADLIERAQGEWVRINKSLVGKSYGRKKIKIKRRSSKSV